MWVQFLALVELIYSLTNMEPEKRLNQEIALDPQPIREGSHLFPLPLVSSKPAAPAFKSSQMRGPGGFGSWKSPLGLEQPVSISSTGGNTQQSNGEVAAANFVRHSFLFVNEMVRNTILKLPVDCPSSAAAKGTWHLVDKPFCALRCQGLLVQKDGIPFLSLILLAVF